MGCARFMPAAGFMARRTFAMQVGQTRYTKEHEWVKLSAPNQATIGITDFAQSALGDVVFVDLPEAGSKLAKGDAFGSVESVKAASSVYAPVSGTVAESNEAVKDDNSLVNSKPESDGWMIKLDLSNPAELDELLERDAYDKHVQESQH